MSQIHGTDYKLYGLWKQKIFSCSYWAHSFNGDIARRMSIDTDWPATLELTGGYMAIEHGEITKIVSCIKQEIHAENHNFLDQLVIVASDVRRESKNMAQQYMTEVPTSDNWKILDTAINDLNFVWLLAAGYFVVAGEEVILEVVAQNNIPAEAIGEMVPLFDSGLEQYTRGIAKLAKLAQGKSVSKMKEDEHIASLISQHAKKYAWIENSNCVGKSLDVDMVYQLVSEYTKEIPSESRYALSDYDQKTQFVFRAMSQLGSIKQLSAEAFFEVTFILKPYFESIASSMGISYDRFLLLHRNEVGAYLGGKMSSEEIHKRTKMRSQEQHHWFMYTSRDGDEIFCEDQKLALEVFEQVVPRVDSGTEKIVGTPAFRGIVTGTVKVVLNIDDFAKFDEGDILVTTMTTIDFVVLMHRAKAIVTDIGGMLCHAAIVSREMQKPCIIGTKIATQVLKDGDLVEVDANAGIIKILK